MPVTTTAIRRARQISGFLRYLIGRFNEDRGLQTAGALSFTTVLALVPLVAVSVYALSGFPVFNDLINKIHDFIFTNFVPATGEVVQKYLEQFAHKAAHLTSIGALLLFITALMVMDTIDRALNDIWRIKVKRKRVSSFLVYWAVLTLGPLFVGLSLASTSYVASLPIVKETVGGEARAILFGIMPFTFTVIAFTLLYTLVPNRPVKVRYALLGAVAASFLFEAAKKGFAYYVTQVPTYAVIYGSLAAIPIFLVWIYLSWVIALLGAELTYCAQHYRPERAAARGDITGLELIAAYRVVGHLARAQHEGKTVTEGELLTREPNLNEDSLNALNATLQAAKLVHRTGEGQWSLSRDAATLTLADLYRALPAALPQATGPWRDDHPWNRALAQVLDHANRSLDRVMDTPLLHLYGFEPTAARGEPATHGAPPRHPGDDGGSRWPV